uniref:Uncharacterized protein n=1 Tax=Sphaerodactylus townsendi TaxID=933632 RepID=A0ACB8FZF7_9SAUR
MGQSNCLELPNFPSPKTQTVTSLLHLVILFPQASAAAIGVERIPAEYFTKGCTTCARGVDVAAALVPSGSSAGPVSHHSSVNPKRDAQPFLFLLSCRGSRDWQNL